ncbi:MAG: putative quinol monooxygenase [Rhodocyclaceae bacterium]
MPQTIAVVATITAHAEHARQVEEALRIAVPAVREEAGCERYELHRDLANPHQFVMIERWQDEAALARHVEAPAFQALAKALDGRAQLLVARLAPLA